MVLPEDMIGAIKIKDGLFIGDEFAAQVSPKVLFNPKLNSYKGFRICGCKQSDPHYKLRWKTNPKQLGRNWSDLPDILLAGLGKLNSV